MQLVEVYTKRKKQLYQLYQLIIQKLVDTQLTDHLYHDAFRQKYNTHCDSDLIGDIFVEFVRSSFGMLINIYPVEHKPGYRNVVTVPGPGRSLYTCTVSLDYYSLTPDNVNKMLFDVLYNYTRQKNAIQF